MILTDKQREQVDDLIASCTGQCSCNPNDELETIIAGWPVEAREEARERMDQNIFYCDGCGWYCDTDERHAGDLCDDCHDDREDEDD